MTDEGCAVCAGPLPARAPKSTRPRKVCDKPECLSEAHRHGGRLAQVKLRKRRAALPTPSERRCSRCSESKPLDAEHFYVAKRDRAGAFDRWCKPCRKLYRKEKLNDRAAKRWAAIKADPVRHRQHKEIARINYKLKREREQGQLSQRICGDRADDGSAKRLLDALPLAAVVRGHVDRRRANGGAGEPLHALALEAGVSIRTLERWEAFEIKHVTEATADRVLVALGLNPWDVWSAEEVECLTA